MNNRQPQAQKQANKQQFTKFTKAKPCTDTSAEIPTLFATSVIEKDYAPDAAVTIPVLEPIETVTSSVHLADHEVPVLKHIVEEGGLAQLKPGSNSRSKSTSLQNVRTPFDAVHEQTAAQLLKAQAQAIKAIEAAAGHHAQAKGRLKLADRETLKANAAILVQEMVDEFIPIIEDSLRKQLQGDMDVFLKKIINDHK